jgi:phage N-6-adenine-methyltransferase
MNKAVLFSSAKDDWETPQDFFDELDERFVFGLDVAASRTNTKCSRYLGPDQTDLRWRDALTVSWGPLCDSGVCWMNPPYSRGLQGKFIAKAASERLVGVTTVALLPARTDTLAFHRHIYNRKLWKPRPGVEIRFLKGRLKFVGAEHGAPFPSMVVVFNGEDNI